MAGKFQRELALLITGQDISASKTISNVDRQIKSLNSAAGKAGSHLARNIERGVVLGAGVATGALAYAANAAMDWESAFAGVAKTVEGDVSAIGAGIRQMATEIPVAATELAGIAENAGALGVAKEDILGFTETVALLGVTTDLTSDSASSALGHISTVLKLTGTDYEHLGNTLVALGNNGASTESQILGMTESISGAAAIIHLTTDQTLGWASALANTGEEVEAGGSSLQRFFLETQKAVASGGKDLEKFAKASGKSARQFKRDWEQDASGALEDLIVHLGTLSEAEQLATLENLGFTDIRIQRALLKLTANTDNLTDSLKNSSDAWQENSAMTVEAEKRFKTTQSQIQLLKNNFTEAAIVVGSELLPVITELSKEGVDWLKGHQPEIAQFAKDLAAGIRDAVQWAKSLDWDAIGNALKAGAGFAQTLVDAFVHAPPWLQQFLAVGFVANKFTGGALGDVFKTLASGLIKGVLGMNAGVVYINAGIVNGGGGIPGGVAAGGAGAAGTAGAVGLGTVAGVAAVGTVFAGGVTASLLEIEKYAEANNQLAAKGLTHDEIWAYKFYSGDQAYQQASLKHLGRAPSKADYDNALIKLQQHDAQLSGEEATRQNIANERLEAIRGFTDTQSQTASSLLASQERNEAINQQKQEQTRQQIAAGDTATELAIAGAATRTTQSVGLMQGAVTAVVSSAKAQAITDSRSERAAIAQAEAASRDAGHESANAIKNKRMAVSVYANSYISIADLGKQFTYKTKAGLVQS